MSDYLDNLQTLNIDERILEMRRKARENDVPIIRDKSFSLLLSLVRSKAPKKILEIGTAYGCSSLAMLLESRDAHLTTIEIDEESIVKAKQNFKEFGFENRITLHQGSASDIVPILSGKYDFIFLDGPKGHYYEYLPYLIDLLNEKGILFADNVLFMGLIDGRKEVPRRHNTIYNSLRNFLQSLSKDERFLTTVLDIEDGVSISVRK